MRPIRLKATFLYHCAFVHRPHGPTVEVLLSAASKEDQHAQTHHVQHIASLRIPEECVADDSEWPGTEQFTETADRPMSTDLLWDLRGYDLWIDRPDHETNGNGHSGVDVFEETVDDTGQRWIVANFRNMTGVGVSSRLLKDDGLPDIIREGARVRVWGGVMRCGMPDKDLKTRRWTVANRQDAVGLSDRMEYEKVITSGDTITLQFRAFEGDRTIKTVRLRPNAETGVIRLHVMNDPTPEAVHALPADPCSELPHFDSYGLLLNTTAARTAFKLPVPQPFDHNPALRVLVLEGDSLCCPCGGAPPEP